MKSKIPKQYKIEGMNSAITSNLVGYEVATPFERDILDNTPLSFYAFPAQYVIAIQYRPGSDTVIVTKLHGTSDKAAETFVLGHDKFIPLLDEQNRLWKTQIAIPTFFDVDRGKVLSEYDFCLALPIVSANDTIIFTKRDEKGKSDMSGIYGLYIPPSYNQIATTELFVCRVIFSDMLYFPSLHYQMDDAAKYMLYSLLLSYLFSMGFPKVSVDELKTLPELFTRNLSQIKSYTGYKFNSLDAMANKLTTKMIPVVVGRDIVNSNIENTDEPYILSECLALGFDILIEGMKRGDLNDELDLKIDVCQEELASIKVTRDGLIVMVKLDSIELDNVISMLDTDNLLVNYPDNRKVECRNTTQDDLMTIDGVSY